MTNIKNLRKPFRSLRWVRRERAQARRLAAHLKAPQLPVPGRHGRVLVNRALVPAQFCHMRADGRCVVRTEYGESILINLDAWRPNPYRPHRVRGN